MGSSTQHQFSWDGLRPCWSGSPWLWALSWSFSSEHLARSVMSAFVTAIVLNEVHIVKYPQHIC